MKPSSIIICLPLLLFLFFAMFMLSDFTVDSGVHGGYATGQRYEFISCFRASLIFWINMGMFLGIRK